MADPKSSLEELKNLARDIENSLIQDLSNLTEYVAQVSELSSKYKVFKDNVKEVKEISTDIKHINESILTITKKAGIEKVRDQDIEQILNRIGQSKKALEEESRKVQEKRQKSLARIAQIEAEQNIARHKSDASKLKNLAKEEKVLEKSTTEHESIIEAIKRENESLSKQEQSLKDLSSRLASYNKEVDKTGQRVGAIELILSRLGKIPIIGPLLELEKLSKEFEKGRKQGFAELKTQVMDLFKSPLALASMAIAAWSILFSKVKEIYNGVLKFDTELTSISNNLGMSVEATRNLVSGFFDAGDAANTLNGLLDSGFLNMTNGVKAIKSLQEGFGTSAMFSNKVLQSQILLTEQMELSAEEALGIQKYTYLSGVDARGFLNTITKQVGMQQKQNGVFLSFRKIAAEVAKISAEISTSYKNNPDFLVKAVIQAQKLGMTLEDTRKMSDSLLNFESSIENELKAELLLGKSLNFEKARALALEGKSAEAAAEMLRQTGGLNELSKMNVIQRKALAESVGLSVEELTKAAQQEQLIRDIGKGSAAALQEQYDTLKAKGDVEKANALLAEIQRHKNGEILAQDIAKANLSKRLEQSTTKIKEIFIDIAQGPIVSMVGKFADLLKHSTAFKYIMAGLLVAATGIATALTAAAIASIVATGGLAAVGAGIAGGIGGITMAGLLGTLGMESSEKPVQNLNDAAISPKGNLMISTPEGQMYKVGDRDYVYTTPVPPSEMLGGGGGGGSEVASLLREMITVLKSGGNVYLDGRKVGETLGMSSNSFA